jgi:RNA polymerase-binding transcription factor DksA
VDAPVKDFMSGDPLAIEPDASTLAAHDLMLDRGIRHLAVVDAQRRVIGVLSIDDLRAAFPFPVSLRGPLSPAEREAAREWRVMDVMTHAPVTIGEEASLGEAAELMAEHRIGCVPVVDADGRLAGIVSETDALHALATSLWSERMRDARAQRSDLDVLVEQLRRERGSIATRLDRYHAVEQALSADLHDEPRDVGDRGADQREVDLTERLDASAARRLEAIDRALDHAAQGRLSLCDGCGGRIPTARLRALPGTTLCVACARAAESAPEPEPSTERLPAGRPETGRPGLGDAVMTRFGEGQLLRIGPFGTCRRCGDVEGVWDADEDQARCGSEGCHQALDDVRERAIVRVEEREVYVDPADLRGVDPAPYD